MDHSKAATDLWRHTLSQIGTVFGRLEYLSSLRNHHTGRYEHYGLEQRVGAERSEATLRHSHETLFIDWLGFSLENQKEEMEAYLAEREETVEEILSSWLRVQPFNTWIPGSARGAERQLFLSDLNVVLELVRRERGVGAPDPDA